ncbi:MAG: response regulator transcription factor [Xenococcaceae cyanobacterium]
MIRILIVDDQKTIRELLKINLEKNKDLEIVGFAVNGKEAIKQVQELTPDLVLMDINMPVMNGLRATKVISQKFPNTKVIVFTTNDNDKYLNFALDVGAKGYLLKDTSDEEISKAIYHAQKGYFYLENKLVEKYLVKLAKVQSDLNNTFGLKQLIINQSQIIDEKLDSSRFFAELQESKFTFRDINNRIRKLEKTISSLRKILNIFITLCGISLLIILTLVANNS